MSKQTAVEWLVININQAIDYIPLSKWDYIADVVNYSKQIEKIQIVKAYQQGQLNTIEYMHKGTECLGNAYDYYYEIYGGDHE